MTNSTFGTSIWGIVVIGGFIVLGAAIIFARLRNRTTPEEDRRTAEATRAMYKEQSAEDDARTP